MKPETRGSNDRNGFNNKIFINDDQKIMHTKMVKKIIGQPKASRNLSHMHMSSRKQRSIQRSQICGGSVYSSGSQFLSSKFNKDLDFDGRHERYKD